MDSIYFKRDLEQLRSRVKLTSWYTGFNALFYYLVSALLLSLFIHSTSLSATALKFLISLIFTCIITIYLRKRVKSTLCLSPYALCKISNTTLQYINDASIDPTPIEIQFADLLQIELFRDCLSPIPYSITLKTDSQSLSLDGFENMQQLIQSIKLSAPYYYKVHWQNSFFPILHVPSLIVFTIYLFLLDLILTFIHPALYIILIIVPLSFGIFHLIQTLFSQQKSIFWHITPLKTNILFAFLGLLPILIGLVINLYK